MNKPIDKAVKAMNEMGKNRQPFLFIIDFEMENPLIFPINGSMSSKILYNFNGIKNYSDSKKTDTSLLFSKHPIPYHAYEESFNKVMKHLRHGNSYLLNLTFPTNVDCNLSLEEIFFKSKAKYKLLYNDQFIFFSPEIFIRIQDNRISSFPMKGTIDASIPDAESVVLNNHKEMAEHATIVDLIRNDLNQVAKQVRVEKFRYVDRIKTHEKVILQVSSEISGILESDWNSDLGNILRSLLPAGSVSGAPKKKTLEIIQETETYKRAYYSGIAGIFDGSTLDSCVIIRYIEKQDEKYVFKSGGGITVNSQAKEEYQELIDKVYVPIS